MASHLSGYNPRKKKKTMGRKVDIDEEGEHTSSTRQEEASSCVGFSSERRTVTRQHGYTGDCKVELELGVAHEEKVEAPRVQPFHHSEPPKTSVISIRT